MTTPPARELSRGAQRVVADLQAQARRLQVARKLPETGAVPMFLIREVQQAFEAFLTTSGETIKDVSRRMGKGFSPSTLSTWRNFTSDAGADYKGDLDGHTRAINRMMEAYAQQMAAPKGPGWVETEAARLIMTAIKQTVRLQAIGVITSDAGRGKTLTLKAAAKFYGSAIYLRVRHGCHTATGLARELAWTLRLKNARTVLDIQHAIEDALRDTGRPLFLDEMHQARPDALELVRDIHDACGIPIVLTGTRRLSEAATSDELFFGQLGSRIAMSLDLNDHIRGKDGTPSRPLHTIKDLRELFASDEVRFTDDGMTALANLANLEGFGGLRLCKQVVVVAATVARGSIDAKLVMAVLKELHGKLGVAHRIEPAMRRQEVKVA